MPRDLQRKVRQAMDYITSSTPCVTFVPATSSSVNYILFISGSECNAKSWGMAGGEQRVQLSPTCFDLGMMTPAHEILHVLGFTHEHNRTLVLTVH